MGAGPVVAGMPVPLTLEDALSRAERDNPELAALRARQGAREQRAAALVRMMGEVAATFLSRIAVPVAYYLIARRGRAEALHQEGLVLPMAA